MTEIIVEFPSPLTEREQKMIYGYHGELIRCKDCKHWKQFNSLLGDCQNKRYGQAWENYPLPETDGEFFCKDGERKEE